MLEALTVCIDYADFLKETVRFNAPLFDRWLIVTTPEDIATREVCRKFNLEVLLSEDGTSFGDEFAKGRLVDRGLQHLTADAWRLHVDADIVFPNHFRRALAVSHIDPACIYGFDRIMCKSWDDWVKLKSSGYLNGGQWDYGCRVGFPEGYHIGTRWADTFTGWTPIGWAQLWHSSADEWRGVRIKPYPARHNTACRTDVQHGLQWDRRKRVLIPEIIAVHLESEIGLMGVNWKGRNTKQFGPDPPDDGKHGKLRNPS